jgi:ABC-type transport system involved in multi-copper enzyme maturation permease subunit
MSVEEQTQEIVDFFNTLSGLSGQYESEFAHGEVSRVKITKQGDEPWDRDYQVTVSLYFPKYLMDTKNAANFEATVYGLVISRFWWMKNLDIDKNSQPVVDKTGDEARTKGKSVQITFSNKGSKIDRITSWRHKPSLLFGLLPLYRIPIYGLFFNTSLGYSTYFVEDFIINHVGVWVITLISIVVTAGYIPNMVQKGSVDLLVSKPISRTGLLLYKYLGGVTFVLINAAVAILGVWIVMGLKTGLWPASFPLTIFLIVFFYAILYSVSVLIGVLTRSSLVAILLSVLFWFLLLGIGIAHARLHAPPDPSIEDVINESSAASRNKGMGEVMSHPDQPQSPVVLTVDALHFALPRTNELGYLTKHSLSQELLSEQERKAFDFQEIPEVNVWETVGMSFLFIALMLGIACWRFSVRDY